MNITQSIQILSDAENDLDEARKSYEKQGESVGNYFWDSLLSDIGSLVVFAGIHKKEFGFYRMFSKRFPYAIYYDVNGDVASVVAVLPPPRFLAISPACSSSTGRAGSGRRPGSVSRSPWRDIPTADRSPCPDPASTTTCRG